MSGLFVSRIPFLFQVWPDLKWNQDSADRPEELLCPLTRSYLLLLPLGRLLLLALPFLLGIFLPLLRSPPFPPHAFAPIPLFLAKVQLSPTLTLSSLTIWYSGQTALFLLLLAKAAPAYLPTAFSVALRPLSPFQQAPICSSFSAEACAILHALCWSRQPQQACHFSYLLLQTDSRSVVSSVFPFTSNSLTDLAGTVFALLFYQATMGPWHSFFLGNDATDELARREALLVPCAIPCSLSPRISCIHSSLFSDWKRTVSSKFFDIQVPSISTEEIAVFSFFYAATNTAYC